MSDQNMEAYRCRVCGGMLEVDRESFGFSRCQNCGNKYRLSAQEARRLKELKIPKQDTSIFVSMTPQDIKREASKRKRNNVVYSLKGIMAIYSLAIVGVFATIMAKYFQGILDIPSMEIAILFALGIGAPMFMSIFSKVYKTKSESLVLTIIMFIFFTLATAAILYFSIPRYLIG